VGNDLIAVLRRSANEKKQRIRDSRTLSEAQRKLALELLRQQTEDEMCRTLGSREFSAFRAFHGWWFRELGVPG
jgi:site-specific recombinase XerD